MKSLLLVFFLSVSVAYAADWSKVRIWRRPDGKVSVMHLRLGDCEKGELLTSCVERMGSKMCPRNADGACPPYADMSSEDLPSDRKSRDKWRFRDINDLSKGIFVDPSVVTKRERIATAESALDAELAKPSPDPVEVIRRSRELEKRKKESS